MISVVMPFYKKYQEFSICFSNHTLNVFNKFKENLELILCVDDPVESEELLTYLNQITKLGTAQIFIKVLLNQQPHTWRCPSKAINVGIKNARYSKLLVMSPETLPLPGSIELLMSRCTDQAFSFGIIKGTTIDQLDFNQLSESFNYINCPIMPYGSICFTKEMATMIGGYDESLLLWGGDDDDFRERLKKAGFHKNPSFAKFVHVSIKTKHNRSPDKKIRAVHTREVVQAIQNKISCLANDGIFGNEFQHVAFDYQPISNPAELLVQNVNS